MATETTLVNFVEGAAASTPAASRVVTYAKADGLMYSKDDAGTETLMSSGSASGIPASILDAKGDIIAASAADTAAKVTVGANGTVLEAASGASAGVQWDFPPGYELDYVQITSPVAITATTEGTAQTVITGTSQAYAAVPMVIHFYSPRVVAASLASASIIVILVEDSTVLGNIYLHRTPSADGANYETANGFMRYTPSAATHQYLIKAYRGTGNGSVDAGAGGAGADLPAFIRITKA